MVIGFEILNNFEVAMYLRW